MNTNDFHEENVDRDGAGRFANKTHTEAAQGTDALRPATGWVSSDDDPDIVWVTTPEGKSATVSREVHDVPYSADYDLSHAVESYYWTVDDDETGQILADGEAKFAGQARRDALAALGAQLSPEGLAHLNAQCRCDRLAANFSEPHSHARGCPLRGPDA